MHRTLKLATAIILIAVVGFGVFFIWQNMRKIEAGDTGPKTPSVGQVGTIIYDGSSFEPQVLRTSMGERVRIINQSSSDLILISDSAKNADLDIGTIDPGVSRSITLTKTGTWNYYNERVKSQRGSIIVDKDKN